jgi:uncharacterized membrane protein YhaH (DUF805 family)
MPLLSRANLFTLQGSVDRREYLWVGVILTLVKYAVEALTAYVTTGLAYTPLEFFSPLMSSRLPFIEAGGAWLGWAWLLWTIPFVWIAVAMTFRRAKDARITPWISMLILVPVANIITMLAMAYAPSAYRRKRQVASESTSVEPEASPWSPPATDTTPAIPLPVGPEQSAVLSAFAGLAVGTLYTLLIIAVCTLLLQTYGAALFFGAPIVAGTATGYLFNRHEMRSVWSTLSLGLLLSCGSATLLLLFGLEGAICIIMALPLLAPLTLVGTLIGREIASNSDRNLRRDDRGMLGALLLLPFVATVEPLVAGPVPLVVTTSIDIQATPQEVWDVVVAFPDIEAPPAWYFRWGIAAPERARIEGHGVGAVRHCEFTTGSFVEPITVWDEPRRLAFDVTEQPAPMFELSPYRHLHPPHLDISFRSTKGEFRLEALPNGGTRLIGTTWYELDIAPHPYWQWWTGWIVHRIHSRVLEHIKVVAEQKLSTIQ